SDSRASGWESGVAMGFLQCGHRNIKTWRGCTVWEIRLEFNWLSFLLAWLHTPRCTTPWWPTRQGVAIFTPVPAALALHRRQVSDSILLALLFHLVLASVFVKRLHGLANG